MTDTQALDAIFRLLDAREWGVEDMEEISRILLATGRRVREPDYQEGEEVAE